MKCIHHYSIIRDVPDIRFRFRLAGYPAIFFESGSGSGSGQNGIRGRERKEEFILQCSLAVDATERKEEEEEERGGQIRGEKGRDIPLQTDRRQCIVRTINSTVCCFFRWLAECM